MRVSAVLLLALASCAKRPPPPPKITAAHVLVGFRGARLSMSSITRSKAEARDLAATIASRARHEDFASLASRYSDDVGTRFRGGDLGEIGPDALAPELAKAVFSLDPGEIAGPIETDLGFEVLKRTR